MVLRLKNRFLKKGEEVSRGPGVAKDPPPPFRPFYSTKKVLKIVFLTICFSFEWFFFYDANGKAKTSLNKKNEFLIKKKCV